MFYYWNALIHTLAEYNSHSLRRLELAGVGPSFFNKESEVICFGTTFGNMSSLINLKVIYLLNLIHFFSNNIINLYTHFFLQKLSLDLNSNTYKLLPALCSMPQLEILVLHINEDLGIKITDDIWVDLKKYW